jgi:hypothetical protein
MNLGIGRITSTSVELRLECQLHGACAEQYEYLIGVNYRAYEAPCGFMVLSDSGGALVSLTHLRRGVCKRVRDYMALVASFVFSLESLCSCAFSIYCSSALIFFFLPLLCVPFFVCCPFAVLHILVLRCVCVCVCGQALRRCFRFHNC